MTPTLPMTPIHLPQAARWRRFRHGASPRYPIVPLRCCTHSQRPRELRNAVRFSATSCASPLGDARFTQAFRLSSAPTTGVYFRPGRLQWLYRHLETDYASVPGPDAHKGTRIDGGTTRTV